MSIQAFYTCKHDIWESLIHSKADMFLASRWLQVHSRQGPTETLCFVRHLTDIKLLVHAFKVARDKNDCLSNHDHFFPFSFKSQPALSVY